MKRRRWWAGAAILALAAAAILATTPAAPAPGDEMVVYKDPNCGCCEKWIEHVESAGFEVAVRNRSSLADIKARYGITAALMSCHTAVIDGYAVEGHVPADVIQRLLRERPAVTGIAVPGMPGGAPGMEGAIRERYNILTFDRSGVTRIYATR